MRTALRTLASTCAPDHVGLAYDGWAPLGPGGRVPDTQRNGWLARLEAIPVASGYAEALDRWTASFASDPTARVVEIELASRLLLGHGNPSPTEVGLTVHRTWGVPLVPGSALKGLLAHWVEATFGPTRPGGDPRSAAHPEPDRAPFQGATWSGRRIEHGPGAVHRLLFGAPSAQGDPERRRDEPPCRSMEGRGELGGSVLFHDALYAGTAAPFKRDVLTVHQKSYYDRQGKGGWPNDHESPVPVSFLTVQPGMRFLLALSGATSTDGDWVDFALPLLRDALREWGVGGKTSAGYGRIRADDAGWQPVDVAAAAARQVQARERAAEEAKRRVRLAATRAAQARAGEHPTIQALDAWLEGPGHKLTHAERLAALVGDWKQGLDELPGDLRSVARNKILAAFPKQKREQVRAALGL